MIDSPDTDALIRECAEWLRAQAEIFEGDLSQSTLNGFRFHAAQNWLKENPSMVLHIAERSIRLDQAVFGAHIRSALTSAFAISMSLRMTTTMATFAGFPTVRSASYLALRSGLNRMATSAGM